MIRLHTPFSSLGPLPLAVTLLLLLWLGHLGMMLWLLKTEIREKFSYETYLGFHVQTLLRIYKHWLLLVTWYSSLCLFSYHFKVSSTVNDLPVVLHLSLTRQPIPTAITAATTAADGPAMTMCMRLRHTPLYCSMCFVSLPAWDE